MIDREPGTVSGWIHTTVVSGLSRVGAANRMNLFRIVIDAFDTPHFFYLSGGSGETISTLWEATLIQN
jgi:hypothetical protein